VIPNGRPHDIFIFGLTAEEVQAQRQAGYHPEAFWAQDQALRGALDAIADGAFSGGDRQKFQALLTSLRYRDPFLVCADFRSYGASRRAVTEAYADAAAWARHSILNTASVGRFSSDRVIAEYARDIWRIGGIGSVDAHLA
jgi:starch phosphorylase